MSVSTPIGIPTELNFDLPSSMLPSRKYEFRVNPYGQSQFTPGQTIQFVIPQTQRTLGNFQTHYITGKVAFTQNGGVVNTDASYVLGSWYSLFNRQVVRTSGGYVLETIEQPGKLFNMITSCVLNSSERQALGLSIGFDGEFQVGGKCNNIGVKLNENTIPGGLNNTANLIHNFAIPLIGILNVAKFFPLWNGDLIIELTLDQLTNYIRSLTANGISGVTLSELEYVCEFLELSNESYAMVMSRFPGQVSIKSQTYTYGSASIATGSGSVDIPFQVKVQSMKQLFWYASISNAIDGGYGGINPNLDSWQFIVNGTSYPQRPIQAKYPAEAYMQISKSFGSVYSNSHSGQFQRSNFRVGQTAYNEFYAAYNSTVNATNLETDSNKFYQCLDLETINANKESLYSGISTNGQTSTIRLNRLAATTASMTLEYWSCQDVIIVMDIVNGITSVIV